MKLFIFATFCAILATSSGGVVNSGGVVQNVPRIDHGNQPIKTIVGIDSRRPISTPDVSQNEVPVSQTIGTPIDNERRTQVPQQEIYIREVDSRNVPNQNNRLSTFEGVVSALVEAQEGLQREIEVNIKTIDRSFVENVNRQSLRGLNTVENELNGLIDIQRDLEREIKSVGQFVAPKVRYLVENVNREALRRLNAVEKEVTTLINYQNELQSNVDQSRFRSVVENVRQTQRGLTLVQNEVNALIYTQVDLLREIQFVGQNIPVRVRSVIENVNRQTVRGLTTVQREIVALIGAQNELEQHLQSGNGVGVQNSNQIRTIIENVNRQTLRRLASVQTEINGLIGTQTELESREAQYFVPRVRSFVENVNRQIVRGLTEVQRVLTDVVKVQRELQSNYQTVENVIRQSLQGLDAVERQVNDLIGAQRYIEGVIQSGLGIDGQYVASRVRYVVENANRQSLRGLSTVQREVNALIEAQNELRREIQSYLGVEGQYITPRTGSYANRQGLSVQRGVIDTQTELEPEIQPQNAPNVRTLVENINRRGLISVQREISVLIRVQSVLEQSIRTEIDVQTVRNLVENTNRQNLRGLYAVQREVNAIINAQEVLEQQTQGVTPRVRNVEQYLRRLYEVQREVTALINIQTELEQEIQSVQQVQGQDLASRLRSLVENVNSESQRRLSLVQRDVDALIERQTELEYNYEVSQPRIVENRLTEVEREVNILIEVQNVLQRRLQSSSGLEEQYRNPRVVENVNKQTLRGLTEVQRELNVLINIQVEQETQTNPRVENQNILVRNVENVNRKTLRGLYSVQHQVHTLIEAQKQLQHEIQSNYGNGAQYTSPRINYIVENNRQTLTELFSIEQQLSSQIADLEREIQLIGTPKYQTQRYVYYSTPVRSQSVDLSVNPWSRNFQQVRNAFVGENNGYPRVEIGKDSSQVPIVSQNVVQRGQNSYQGDRYLVTYGNGLGNLYVPKVLDYSTPRRNLFSSSVPNFEENYSSQLEGRVGYPFYGEERRGSFVQRDVPRKYGAWNPVVLLWNQY